jgi:hypothetical protein
MPGWAADDIGYVDNNAKVVDLDQHDSHGREASQMSVQKSRFKKRVESINWERGVFYVQLYFQFLVIPLIIVILWQLVPLGAGANQPPKDCGLSSSSLNNSTLSGNASAVHCAAGANFATTSVWFSIYFVFGLFVWLFMLDLLQPGLPRRWLLVCLVGGLALLAVSVAVVWYAGLEQSKYAVAFVMLLSYFPPLVLYVAYIYHYGASHERQRFVDFLRCRCRSANAVGDGDDVLAIGSDDDGDDDAASLRRDQLPRAPPVRVRPERLSLLPGRQIEYVDGVADDGDESERPPLAQQHYGATDFAEHSEDRTNFWTMRSEVSSTAVASSVSASAAPLSDGDDDGVDNNDGSLIVESAEARRRRRLIHRLERQSWSYRFANKLFRLKVRKRKGAENARYSLLGAGAEYWSQADDSWQPPTLSFTVLGWFALFKLALLVLWLSVQVFISEVMTKIDQTDFWLFMGIAAAYIGMRIVFQSVLNALNGKLNVHNLPEIRHFSFFAASLFLELFYRSLFLFAGSWLISGSIAAIIVVATLVQYPLAMSRPWFDFMQQRCRAICSRGNGRLCCAGCFVDKSTSAAFTYDKHIALKSLSYYYSNVSKLYSLLLFLIVFTLARQVPWLSDLYPTLTAMPEARAIAVYQSYAFNAAVELATGLVVSAICNWLLKVDIGFNARLCTILDTRTRMLFTLVVILVSIDVPIGLLDIHFY